MRTLRAIIPVVEAAARHEAGESLRSLARVYGVDVHTLSLHLKRSGFEVREKHESIVLSNETREREHLPTPPSYFYQVRTVQKKAWFVREYRAMHGCSRCSENDPRVLDLHHPDPDTKHKHLRLKRRNMWVGLSWGDLTRELVLCEVLCANCHRKETRELPIPVERDRVSSKERRARAVVGLPPPERSSVGTLSRQTR